MTDATVSIVVPTRGRPESLARCLAALERQSPGEPWEIVVVDDASPEPAPIAEVVARCSRARLVRLPRRAGPGTARNVGGRAAAGSLILFTDDDCEPSSAWASALVERLRAGGEVAAGMTENGSADNPWAAASHLLTAYFTERTDIPFAASNNVACTARVLAALPFDESFPDAAGEDRDWCARLADEGIEIVPVAEARVEHRHRLTPGSFWRQQLRYGRGAYRYHRRARAGRPLERPRFYLGLLRRGLGEGAAVAALVAVSQAAVLLGFLLEAGDARLRSRAATSASGE